MFSFTLEGISEVVCRQLYKHQVGCAFTSGEFREVATTWNEISGRYVEFDPEFHEPRAFRKQHVSNKQASLENDFVDDNDEARAIYNASVAQSYENYKKLLAIGVCKEQARMIMPLCFKNSLVWTASLEATAHFVKLRDHEGAQLEIRNLARAVRELVEPYVPCSLVALMAGH
jgi:thymidylate synthase (FAD)